MKAASLVWTERVKAIAAIVAAVGTVLIPIMAAIIGNQYNEAIKEREIGARYVELAISILREKPTADNTILRKWAIEIVDKHASIKLSDEAKKELLNKRISISHRLFELMIRDELLNNRSPEELKKFNDLLSEDLQKRLKE